jgi:hypothetical protein
MDREPAIAGPVNGGALGRSYGALRSVVFAVVVVSASLTVSSTGMWACAPEPTEAATSADDAPVILVGGAVFADGDRVARRLQHMAQVTGILGGSHVELVQAEAAGTLGLAAALRDLAPCRALLVIVGDLSLMDGIDPDAAFPPQKELSSRIIDWDAFDEGLGLIEREAQRLGAELLFCTPPLGIQGRLEVPELLDVAARLRSRGRVLDLTRQFAEREPGPWFRNGLDQLDEYGHDALADTLYRALLTSGAPIKARTLMEKRARNLMAALHAWAEGDETALEAAAESGLVRAAPEGRVTAMAAALETLRTGIDETSRTLWKKADPGGAGVPGLAVGQLLAGLPTASTSGFEAELLDIFATLIDSPAEAVAPARALTNAHPERVEAWTALLLAEQFSGRERPSLKIAKTRQGVFDHGPLSRERGRELLASSAVGVPALPALLLIFAPYEGALVTGPSLQSARRKARVGMPEAALNVLDAALDAGPCPESWGDARDRIAAGP